MTELPMVKNRFVVEVGDTQTLKQTITRLRAIDAVFDAYRVTPHGGELRSRRPPASTPTTGTRPSVAWSYAAS
jgi:hypothetical protein